MKECLSGKEGFGVTVSSVRSSNYVREREAAEESRSRMFL
jgi:hypothetical protein